MKTITIVSILVICSLGLLAQERFNTRQLTSRPTREGFPSYSPDGQNLVFQRTDLNDSTGQNGLWKILLDHPSDEKQLFRGVAEHAKWSPDGQQIVFDADTGQSIKVIPADGGEPIAFLPDSIHIMNGGLPCWSPDGSHIAFIEGSTISLCIYDDRNGQVNSIFGQPGMVPLPGCWSADGAYVLIALMDRQSRKSTIWRISSDGKEKKQITGHRENFYRYLALSPDGSLLVYGAIEDGFLGLYIMPAEGGPSLPLAVTENAHNDGPCWSPDGKMVAYSSGKTGNGDIWIVDLDPDQVKHKLQELSGKIR